jgi:hypothetical protein
MSKTKSFCTAPARGIVRLLLHQRDSAYNVTGATDTTALDAIEQEIEQAIEQMRSGSALAEPDLFITSPASWSALRRLRRLAPLHLEPQSGPRGSQSVVGRARSWSQLSATPTTVCSLTPPSFGKRLAREGLVMRQGTNLDDFSRNLMVWVVELRGNLGWSARR